MTPPSAPRADSWFTRARRPVGPGDALSRAALLLVALGILWRLLRYALVFPLWMDEAAVALNLMDAGNWAEALRPGHLQAAPALFLLFEKASLALFGPSELALRLVSVVASVAVLFLFAQLARRILEPLPAALATGVLAVSYFPVRFSAEVKPYATDLLVAVVLLLLTVDWLEDESRLRPLAVLLVAAPVAVAVSYPAVFVLAAIGCVLLPRIWRSPDRRAKALFFAMVLAAAAAFLASYFLVGLGQFRLQGGFENQHWRHSFPPLEPLALVVWLVRVHAGDLFAYPLGSVDGMNTLAFLLSLAGIAALHARRRKWIVTLLLLPFAWTLLASALRLYPYGRHPRIAQHLAPGIILLASAGLAAALKFRSPSERRTERRALVVMAVLGCFAVGGIAVDIRFPYKASGDDVLRKLAARIGARAGPADRVVYFEVPLEDVWRDPNQTASLEFYLRRAKLNVAWDGKLDLASLPAGAQVWIIAYRESSVPKTLREELERAQPPFVLAEHEVLSLKKGADRDPPIPCSISRWRRSASP